MKDCKSMSEKELESVSGGFKFNEGIEDIPNLINDKNNEANKGLGLDGAFGDIIEDVLGLLGLDDDDKNKGFL